MFELGALPRFVVHDSETYETYVIDPYDVGVLVPVVRANVEVGTIIYLETEPVRMLRVQECVPVILAAMLEAAPELKA